MNSKHSEKGVILIPLIFTAMVFLPFLLAAGHQLSLANRTLNNRIIYNQVYYASRTGYLVAETSTIPVIAATLQLNLAQYPRSEMKSLQLDNGVMLNIGIDRVQHLITIAEKDGVSIGWRFSYNPSTLSWQRPLRLY